MPHKSLRRCTCTTKATIRTEFDRGQVIFHCSPSCRAHWIKTSRPMLLEKTDRNVEGFFS